jgi:hypothetical protein
LILSIRIRRARCSSGAREYPFIEVVVAGFFGYFGIYIDLQNRVAFDLNAPEVVCSPQFDVIYGGGGTVFDKGTCRVLRSLPPPTEVRREFISLLIEHPDNARGIVAAYSELYPYGRDWIVEIVAALDKDESINFPAPPSSPE